MPPSSRPHRVQGSPPPGYDGPRRALVLAGGGMRVAYQAGVMQALFEEGLVFHHADGTSGGTINLAMLFSGLTADAMADRWETLHVPDFASLMPLREYLKGPFMEAMGDADGIREKVFPHLGVDVDAIRAAEGMDGTFNVCNFARKTVEAVPHADVTLPLLVAGISLPLFMPAVDVGGTPYTDAVWIKDANVWEAVRRGAEELWVVWCIGNTPAYRDGFFHQYVHMIEMSANGALFEAFDRVRALNDGIARGTSPYGQRAPVRLHVVRPEHPLPLDPDFFVGRITAAELVARGRDDARRYLAARAPGGLPFTPEVTQMHDPTPGLTFREMMHGPFALGETQPDAGRAAGSRDGHRLALHATIEVDDLERFLNDPDHPGRLTGSVDFTPFGEGLPGGEGVFKLFSAGDAPGSKRMVYELPFEHDGVTYCVAGEKHVRDDPGFDLWSDTTTLYTRLHRGTGRAAPVVGAGVLRLGVEDLVRLVSTMRATHAEGLGEQTRVLGRFGRFFLGQLWDTYASRTAQPS